MARRYKTLTENEFSKFLLDNVCSAVYDVIEKLESITYDLSILERFVLEDNKEDNENDL